MRISHRTTTIAACALLAGVPLTAGTATAGTATACSSTPWTSEPVQLDYHGLWTYTFRLSWCVENNRIAWVEPSVTHVELADDCTWVGSMEEWQRPDREESTWTAFNMSEFSCATADGMGTYAVTPWAIVTVHADGTNAVVDKGIEV